MNRFFSLLIALLALTIVESSATVSTKNANFEKTTWKANVAENIELNGMPAAVTADLTINFLEDGALTAYVVVTLNGFPLPLPIPEGGIAGTWSYNKQVLTLEASGEGCPFTIPPTEGAVDGDTVSFTIDFMGTSLDILLVKES